MRDIWKRVNKTINELHEKGVQLKQLCGKGDIRDKQLGVNL